MPIIRFALITLYLILTAVAQPVFAIDTDNATAANKAKDQAFVIRTALYSGQLEEHVELHFSDGQHCTLQVTEETPEAECRLRLPTEKITYWITGHLVQTRDDAKFWQSKTIRRVDKVAADDKGSFNPLNPATNHWRKTDSALALIENWNRQMAYFKTQYPHHHESSYPEITFGDTYPSKLFTSNAYPADYIALLTTHGLPEIDASEYERLSFYRPESHDSVWSYLNSIVDMPERSFSIQQRKVLKESRVFFSKRDGEIIEYFTAGHASCNGKIKGVWVAELIFDDLRHDVDSQRCPSFTDFLRNELNEIYEYIPPRAHDISYTPTTDAIELELHNGEYYSADSEIDYYLVSSQD